MQGLADRYAGGDPVRLRLREAATTVDTTQVIAQTAVIGILLETAANTGVIEVVAVLAGSVQVGATLVHSLGDLLTVCGVFGIIAMQTAFFTQELD